MESKLNEMRGDKPKAGGSVFGAEEWANARRKHAEKKKGLK